MPQRVLGGHNTTKEGRETDAREGQQAYKEGRFADAVRHLAKAAQASPGDSALSLMLARACERVGWADLAWFLFDRVEAEADAPATRTLANQGKAALERPIAGYEPALIASGALSPAWLARARSETRDGETSLSWLVRQDACTFDRMVETVLSGTPLPPFRPPKDRLGMRLMSDRRISQGDLKQALSLQARQHRPLGAILVSEFGLPEPILQAALRGLPPLNAPLGPRDAPPALLMRWGAMTREHWEAAKTHGPKAFEVLVANGSVMASNVRRADAFRKAKSRLLVEGRFRLGEILVANGVIDRETLAKALAWQVDQPYRLGELLIRHRLASAEKVLEGLVEQARRYDEEAESLLPPVEQPPPPPPPAIAQEAPPVSRRRLLLLGLAGASLVGALVFATRYTRGDFAWLSTFIQGPQASTSSEQGAAEFLGGSQSSGPRRERGTAFDPLDLPDTEFSGRPLGEAVGGGMIGSRTDGAFVGDRVGEGFVGTALPHEGVAAPVGEHSGLGAVGQPSQEKAVGTSGVTDSVRYGKQTASGAPRRETSREAELLALNRVQYPIQQGRHLAEALPAAGQERLQAPVNPENQLQAPIGLGRTVDGSPPESIQVRRDTAIFRLRLGRSLFDRKDPASAREEFLSAIGLDPTLSPPHYYLGRIAEERGDRELARKWYASYLSRSSGGEHSDEVRERLSGLGN